MTASPRRTVTGYKTSGDRRGTSSHVLPMSVAEMRAADPMAFQMTGASPRPHACVVLAIDPGATAGWAVLAPDPAGPFVLSRVDERGIARTARDRLRAVLVARGTADESGLPIIVAMECWSNHGRFAGARTMSGLGSTAGRWLEQIEAAGIPKRRVVRVKPETWRAAVLGMRTGGRSRVTGDDCRAAAIRYVKMRFGVECGADEAEAVAIAVWAMHSVAVGRVVPKRKVKR